MAFPRLTGLELLSSPRSKVDVPDHFLRKNRSSDANAQCTVVAVSYRDYGYQILSSWLDPFRAAMLTKVGGGSDNSNRCEVFRINISEGWLNKWMLRGLIRALTRKNTPPEDRDSTLLYFGGTNELENFRDALRMHNVMTGFVFLLDGLGRVRFAGSGPATDDDVDRLIRFARVLISKTKPVRQRKQNRSIGSASSNRKRTPKR